MKTVKQCYQNAHESSLQKVEIINKREVKYFNVKFPNGAIWKLKEENSKMYRYESLGHYSEWGWEEVTNKQ